MLKKLALVAISVIFVSCGGTSTTGGNSGSAVQSTLGEAQGAYSGTSSSPNGSYFDAIILPDDTLYVIYGTRSGDIFYIGGMIKGTGRSDHGTYTTSWLGDFHYDGTSYNGTLTATYVVGSSFNGTLAENGTNISFNGTAMPTLEFNYKTPASLSAVTGTWMGTFLDGTAGTIDISSNGNVSGTSGGCSFTGTISPDASKNFFKLSVTFGASPCVLPNLTANGIGVVALLPDGVTQQLIVVGTAIDVQRFAEYGTVFWASR